MTLDLSRLRALLLDLDGVLFVGDDALPGAVAAVDRLAEQAFALRFVTNTTLQPRRELLAKLRELGLRLAPTQLFTPATLARTLIASSGAGTFRLLGAPAIAEDLGPGLLSPDARGPPDWVVVGLHPPSFRHDVLSAALGDLLGGARLLALHANRRWRTTRGLEVGLGAYVQALAYAAGVEPLVVGKPSADFFESALADLGVPRDVVAMVGDDVEADVAGAQAVGIAGILVRTGKFHPRDLERGIEPDLVVDDVGDLATRLAPRPRP